MHKNSTIKKLNKERETLIKELETLPKGAVRRKRIRGREYYYLQYREGSKVRSEYIHAINLEDISQRIEKRHMLEARLKEYNRALKEYTRALGIHDKYRPVKDVDYDSYTLFMSGVAHDFKRLGLERFLATYDTSKYRGIHKRYLKGFIDYVAGINRPNTRKGNDLVLDPYTYLMYFKYGDQSALQHSLERAIPAFLNQGLLITDVQEAVR